MPKKNKKRAQQVAPANKGEQYQQLVGKAHQPKSLVEFFHESPLVGIDVDLERAKDEGRAIEL